MNGRHISSGKIYLKNLKESREPYLLTETQKVKSIFSLMHPKNKFGISVLKLAMSLHPSSRFDWNVCFKNQFESKTNGMDNEALTI